MKLTSLILATYIFLLTVQPAVTEVYYSFFNKKEMLTHACCKEKSAGNKANKTNNCCDKGVCNPFGCCCSFVYNQSAETIAINNKEINSKLITSPEENIFSSFISDCFHPPEIA